MQFCSLIGRTGSRLGLGRKSDGMSATRVVLVYLALTLASTLASASSAGDQDCLACHGQAGMKSDAGKNISIDPAKHSASANSILGCKDCPTTIKEFPHPAKITR